jgi:hypothetical protein
MKQDTQYRKVIPIEIWVLCVIYKLAHGTNLLMCNELFAISKSRISKVLYEFVAIMNVIFKKVIARPTRAKMSNVMKNFKQWCGLPRLVHNIINGTHIIISKPITFLNLSLFNLRIIIITIKRANIPIVVEGIGHCSRSLMKIYYS